MKRFLPLFALTMLAATGIANAQLHKPASGATIHEKPTAEFPFEVELLPEKSSFMVDEPVFITFRVNNPSDQEWTILHGGDSRNMRGRPESFTFSATAADGTLIKQLDGGMQFGGLFTGNPIPAQGHFDFRLFLPSWLELKSPGKYRIQAGRVLKLSSGKGFFQSTKENTHSFNSEASAEVEILPRDEAKFGALIQDWVDTLSKPNDESNNGALAKIRVIQDNRVLPFLVRAARNYAEDSLNVAAVSTLARYNDESAVDALGDALKVSAKDIGPTYPDHMKRDGAQHLRHFAASSLSQNAHPKAWQVLKLHLHDDYYAVRLTVMQRAVKQPLAEAEPILKAMFNDKDKKVSDEAQYLWKQLHPTPKP